MAEGFNANPTYDEAVKLIHQAELLKIEATGVYSTVDLTLRQKWLSTQYRAKLNEFRRQIVSYIQTIEQFIEDARKNSEVADANHPKPRVFNKNLALQHRRLYLLGQNTESIARQMEQLRQDQARYVELQALLQGRSRPRESKKALLEERAAIMREISGTGTSRQGMQVGPQGFYNIVLRSRITEVKQALELYELIDEFNRLHEKLFLPQAAAAGGGAAAVNVNKPSILKF